MAVTPFQSDILRLLSASRRSRGESVIAGGVALNTLLDAPRRSRDIDVFHDTESALAASWSADRQLLTAGGYAVDVLREAPSFVEALIQRGGDRTSMQWARDSAFRFFPFVEDDLMGLTLHPFDLATNKVLALVGRLEARDWIDTIACDEKLQPLGYLVWAACGKDPGFNPRSLLAAAARQHYCQDEIGALDFEGRTPDAGQLSNRWRALQVEADRVCGLLPADHLGRCVLANDGRLYRGSASELLRDVEAARLRFHPGRIGGAWPTLTA